MLDLHSGYNIFDELLKIRSCRPMKPDSGNNDRYSIIVDEEDGTHTAYYFSTPIFDERGKLIDRKFKMTDKYIHLRGSNATVKIFNDIVMENRRSFCKIKFAGIQTYADEHEIKYDTASVYPTLNGIALLVSCSANSPFKIKLSASDIPFFIKSNERVFAYMADEFTPLFTLSVIGETENDSVVAPARLTYGETNSKEYIISVFPSGINDRYVLFEINMYEPKLFQDTTVESQHPFMNNPFGSVAFIGNTPSLGEQWLYSRPDFDKLPLVANRTIISTNLFIPMYGKAFIPLSLSKPEKRFCSFGSDWDNKVSTSNMQSVIKQTQKYIDIDVSDVLLSQPDKHIVISEGFVIKSTNQSENFAVTATADNYISPQILAITYIK